MKRVKVYGAGSIGNHLTQAARRIGALVDVVDVDPEALRRMREEIYPSRYGAWDPEIRQFTPADEPKGGYDLICLGTPPDVRMKLAQSIVAEAPRAILLEKPLCAPDLDGLEAFLALLTPDIKVFMGYDHAVAPSVTLVRETIMAKGIGDILGIDVEFREHWGGIFAAHPWLSGPTDTYLGFTKRGGGASGEHSHALHLMDVFTRASGWGTAHSLAAQYEYDETKSYDAVASFALRFDQGHVARVIQDVLTKPARKFAVIQGTMGRIEWVCGGGPEKEDVVRIAKDNEPMREQLFQKKRPDDFFYEMNHIDDVLAGKTAHEDSPIALASGVRVMKLLSCVYPHEVFAGPVSQ